MFKKELTKLKLKDIKPSIKKIRWGKRHVGLKEKIINHYNGSIIVSSDNKILDGNHRYYILLEKFGPEHEINVEVAGYTLTTWLLLMIVFSPLIIGVMLLLIPIVLIRKGIEILSRFFKPLV